jgi:acetyl/propionyl-CoA carboxylase alpha subunit
MAIQLPRNGGSRETQSAHRRDREEESAAEVEEGRVSAEIGVAFTNLEVRETEPDSYLFFLNTNVHECRVNERAAAKDSFDVSIRGRSYEVTIVDPKRLRSGQNSDRHHHGSGGDPRADAGQGCARANRSRRDVEKGAGIMVVEAMKMQNEMKSPRDGVVVSINVKPGDTVNAGDVLAAQKAQRGD